MKKSIFLSLLILVLSINTNAQENDKIKNSKAQITFAYPIASNGFHSLEYSNNFSFNILYGLNGGVNGTEIGSLLNYNKGKVKGFQLSGISNINTGNSTGFLLSGIANVCLDSTSGLLLSGLLNYSKQNGSGFQLSTVNIAAKEFKGFQLGVFNAARKIKGIQLGVINFLHDGKDGLPIGLFSIVKNGHFEFELTGGEVMYSNMTYKMGVERFYTIYKVGYSTYKNNSVYSTGIGFGGNITLSEKQKISIDASTNSIIYNNDWEGDLNLLNKLDVNYKYHFTKKLAVLIGPSFNAYTAGKKVNGEFGSLTIPYSVYSNEWTNSKLVMWVGFNAGLSLKL